MTQEIWDKLSPLERESRRSTVTDKAYQIMRRIAKKHGYTARENVRGDLKLYRAHKFCGVIVVIPSNFDGPGNPCPIASRWVTEPVEHVRADMIETLVRHKILTWASERG